MFNSYYYYYFLSRNDKFMYLRITSRRIAPSESQPLYFQKLHFEIFYVLYTIIPHTLPNLPKGRSGAKKHIPEDDSQRVLHSSNNLHHSNNCKTHFFLELVTKHLI